METRLATVADAPTLAVLHAESFGDAAWNFVQIVESLALLTTHAWVVIDNNEIQGFIICQIVAGEAEILTFCVTPSYRRRGAARLLLEKVLHAEQTIGVHRLFLEVAADNQAALALYARYGFKPNGTRAGYYTHEGKPVDALMLVLGL